MKRFMPGDMVSYQTSWAAHNCDFYVVIGWLHLGLIVEPASLLPDEQRECRLVLFPFGRTNRVISFSWDEMRYIGIAVVSKL